MTATRNFERELESWLEAEAPMTAPAGLHDQIIDRAGRSRPRPFWLVALRGETFGGSVGALAWPRTSVTVLVLLGLLAGLLAAVVVGALVADPPTSTVVNGSIAYSVFEDGGRANGQASARHVMNADGTGDRRTGPGSCPTYSSDGRWLAYRSDWISSEVVVEAVDGSFQTVVLAEDDSIHPSSRPYALSPDGSRIAWIKPLTNFSFDLPDGTSEGGLATNELWVTPVSGGPGTRVVAGSMVQSETYWEPVWSPDGSRIAFQSLVAVPSEKGPSIRSGVYVVDADGSDLHAISTRPAAGSWAGLGWSRDGRYLAYLGIPDGEPLPSTSPTDAAYRDPALDIFVVGSDGMGERNVTNSTAFERRPSWSPDGSGLAFEMSDDGERYRLVIAAMDDGAPTEEPRLGPASDSFAWSPDGSQLSSVLANQIRTVDVDLRLPLVTVQRVESGDPAFGWSIETGCAPSWQRLDR